MASSVAQTNLDSLIDQGLIYQKADSYRITEAGRNLLDMDGKPSADYSRVPTEAYVPSEWRVREGGNDAFQIKSRGMI